MYTYTHMDNHTSIHAHTPLCSPVWKKFHMHTRSDDRSHTCPPRATHALTNTCKPYLEDTYTTNTRVLVNAFGFFLWCLPLLLWLSHFLCGNVGPTSAHSKSVILGCTLLVACGHTHTHTHTHMSVRTHKDDADSCVFCAQSKKNLLTCLQTSLLETDPVTKDSIEARLTWTSTLNMLQVLLLRSSRGLLHTTSSQPCVSCGKEEDTLLQEALLFSIQGVASGMGFSG